LGAFFLISYLPVQSTGGGEDKKKSFQISTNFTSLDEQEVVLNSEGKIAYFSSNSCLQQARSLGCIEGKEIILFFSF
jgi:hypothetical protein